MSIFRAVQAGWGAFREAWLNADPLQQQAGGLTDFDAYSQYMARQSRYDQYWAMWQSNYFRDQAHNWAPAVKHAFGIYEHTRNLFNPTNRLVEFHVAHIVGGHLDAKAGDGESVKSAIPILTANEAIRPAIAQLWRDEKWQAKKSLWTRFGSCFGDGGLIVDDDPQRQRVTRRVVHPGHIKWVDQDSAGHVLSYIFEKWRYDPRTIKAADLNPTIDPRSTKVMVRYNETADIINGKVVYRTYLDGKLFNWRGYTADGAELPAEWEVPYDFIPLTLVQHMDVGLPWGVGEPHLLRSKANEVDDLASGHHDGIRKRIRAPKLLAGLNAPTGPPFPRRDPSETIVGSEKGREKSPFLYGPPDAKVFDLTNDLDSVGVNASVQAMIEEIERDFPELQMDVFKTGDPSGRALRVARQRTENKIQERRIAYDAALVESHKFALAIGARQGYPGYEGFDFDPREPGPLDHEIGHRPVFQPDPIDDIEEGSMFWTMVGAAVTAGMPLEVVLEREGWSPEDIGKVVTAKKAAADEQMKRDQQANARQPIGGFASDK